MLNRFVYLCLILSIFAITSCASLDHPAEARQDHLDAMTQELQQKASANLTAPLSLTQCIRLAMASNYKLRLSSLRQRLSELDLDMAFSNFLPQVEVAASYVGWHGDASFSLMNMNLEVLDKPFRGASVTGVVPIFMPATWLLYGNRKLGMEQSALMTHMARQSVQLQVTVLYYQCLICEDEIVTLKSQVSSTKSQYERVKSMLEESQVRDWECTQAETQYKAKEIQLSQAERQLTVTRGKLLVALGMSPEDSDKLQLKRDDEASAALPSKSTAELILSTLETHPELSIQDRSVVESENTVRLAITNFLPKLAGFATGLWSPDTMADHATHALWGLSASMDVFKGFANVATYKEAKVARQAANLNRDEMFLTIMLEVTAAEAQLRDAWDAYQIAVLNHQAWAAKYKDYQSRYDEGLEPLYKLLDAHAQMDAAEELMVRVNYQRHIAQAQLAMAMGVLQPPEDVITPEAQQYKPRVKTEKVLLKK